MSATRMTIAEFAQATGQGAISAINALRRDSALPKCERAYPFIETTPPEDAGGKWHYNIPRAKFEQWQAGELSPVIDYDALAKALAPRLMQQLAEALVRDSQY